MPELPLPDKVVAVHAALDAAGISHAFGGALALAYYAEPRATVDIDINLFLAPARVEPVFASLASLGVEGGRAVDTARRDGQCRAHWGRTPLDLFFAYLPVHDAMHRDARTVPFGEDTIPILAPEHLVACKVAFDRGKDWIDVEQLLLATGDLRPVEVMRWVRELVGEGDSRARRFEQLARDLLGEDALGQS